MRFAHMALLFVCLSLPMYMLGYTSPLGNLIKMQGGAPITTDLIKDVIFKDLFNPITIGASIILGIGAAFLGGFSAVYAIPFVLFFLIFNYVIVPSSSVWNGACSPQIVNAAALCIPSDWALALTLFLNLIVLLTFAEYVRGGG